MSSTPNTSIENTGYRIKAVASTTGLSTHVIRKWEERYHLVQPHRSNNGYRVFSEEDIQLLLFIKTKLAAGASIGQLARTGPAKLRQAMQQTPLDLSPIPTPYRKDAKLLLEAARHQHLDGIKKKLEHWILSMGLQEAMMKLIFPILKLIGDQWHQGGISISGEHRVSQLVRQHLLSAIRQNLPSNNPRAVVACVPGDYHEIAPLTATMFLQNLGWQGTYLGPNVSFEVLQMALRRKQTPLMILSCIIEPDTETFYSWLQEIIQHLVPHTTVALGGAGLLSYKTLLKQYSISYLRTIQDLTMFSRNNHSVLTSDVRFLQSSCG